MSTPRERELQRALAAAIAALEDGPQTPGRPTLVASLRITLDGPAYAGEVGE